MLAAFLVSVVAPLFAANPPDDKPAPKGPAELQGTWLLVSVEANGRERHMTDSHAVWVIKGDRVQYGGEEIIRLAADPGTMPKVVDLHFRSPKRVFEGIYSVEKDTLKICVNGDLEGVKERPVVFSTNGKANWRLLTFERTEAEEGDATEHLSGFIGVALRRDEDKDEVKVAGTLEESPASKAGLKEDDVILRIGKEEVRDLQGAVETVRRAKPGSKLDFRIRREGKESDVAIRVGVFPFSLLVQLG